MSKQRQYDVADTPWGFIVLSRERFGQDPWPKWTVYAEAPTFHQAVHIATALRKEEDD